MHAMVFSSTYFFLVGNLFHTIHPFLFFLYSFIYTSLILYSMSYCPRSLHGTFTYKHLVARHVTGMTRRVFRDPRGNPSCRTTFVLVYGPLVTSLRQFLTKRQLIVTFSPLFAMFHVFDFVLRACVV